VHTPHLIPDGTVDFYPAFLMEKAAKFLLEQLVANTAGNNWDFLKTQPHFTPTPAYFTNVDWQQHRVFVYGKWHLTPRLTAWQSESGKAYGYSGLKHPSVPMCAAVLSIKQEIEQLTGANFNSVLLNWYRSGADAMGFHADNEPELGTNPTIASLSLGATRKFVLKHNHSHHKETYNLNNGSLLVMRGATQHHWTHALPRSAKVHEGRINLTFRHIQ
jgi:alkylated DNA repair dioxygenase AlkB